MKKNMFATFAFAALAAFALTPSALAVGDEGDIVSIQAVPYADYGTEGNAASPLNVGETFYVRVRLLNQNWQDVRKPVPEPHPWVFERNGTALPSDYKDVMYRPALRLAIGSKQVNAEYSPTGPEAGQVSGLNPDNNFYTDLYFSYKVQEGELGQPIRLVGANGQIVGSVDDMDKVGKSFNLVNVTTAGRVEGYWNLTNDLGGQANFWYCFTGTIIDMPEKPAYPSEGVGDVVHMDYDKVWPGIYVQTIDFEGVNGDVAPGIWRQVYQELDSEVGKSLAIKGFGPTTVYVWSSDPSVAVPEGDVDGSVTDGRTVVKVTLRADGEPVPLRLMGGTAEAGKTCKIYLCSQKNPAKDWQGKELPGSMIERTVQLVAAPDPFITISRASDGARSGISIEASTNYQNCVQMRVSFTKAYDASPTTVKLNPTAADDPVAGTYVKLLADVNGDPTVDPSIDEVTVPAGEKEAFFYVFPLGSTPDLKATGITFTPTTDNPYFDETKKAAAVVKVSDQKPVISELNVATSAMQGDKVDVDVTIKDNWRDLQKTLNTAGYKVVVAIGSEKLETNEVHFVEEESITFSAGVPTSVDGAVSGYVRVWDATHTRSSDYV